MLLRMMGQIKVSSDRFRCIVVVFLYVAKVFLLVVSLFRRRNFFFFFAKSASYTVDDIGLGTGKMISDLKGSLGSRQFSTLQNEKKMFCILRVRI